MTLVSASDRMNVLASQRESVTDEPDRYTIPPNPYRTPTFVENLQRNKVTLMALLAIVGLIGYSSYNLGKSSQDFEVNQTTQQKGRQRLNQECPRWAHKNEYTSPESLVSTCRNWASQNGYTFENQAKKSEPNYQNWAENHGYILSSACPKVTVIPTPKAKEPKDEEDLTTTDPSILGGVINDPDEAIYTDLDSGLGDEIPSSVSQDLPQEVFQEWHVKIKTKSGPAFPNQKCLQLGKRTTFNSGVKEQKSALLSMYEGTFGNCDEHSELILEFNQPVSSKIENFAEFKFYIKIRHAASGIASELCLATSAYHEGEGVGDFNFVECSSKNPKKYWKYMVNYLGSQQNRLIQIGSNEENPIWLSHYSNFQVFGVNEKGLEIYKSIKFYDNSLEFEIIGSPSIRSLSKSMKRAK